LALPVMAAFSTMYEHMDFSFSLSCG
jgi:hypothetical protein